NVAVLVADIDAGESLGPVVGETAVFEQVIDLPLQTPLFRLRFESSNFLERGRTADEGQAEAASDLEIICRWGNIQFLAVPVVAKLSIELLEGSGKVRVRRLRYCRWFV